jgi:hypothetical protein
MAKSPTFNDIHNRYLVTSLLKSISNWTTSKSRPKCTVYHQCHRPHPPKELPTEPAQLASDSIAEPNHSAPPSSNRRHRPTAAIVQPPPSSDRSRSQRPQGRVSQFPHGSNAVFARAIACGLATCHSPFGLRSAEKSWC